MAQQTINVGTSPNDGTGDPLRVAFQKINANFTELYSLVSAIGSLSGLHTEVYSGATITVVLGFSGSVINLNDINTPVTYSVSTTTMTITGGANNGDVLIF